jgi:hypothetical protein
LYVTGDLAQARIGNLAIGTPDANSVTTIFNGGSSTGNVSAQFFAPNLAATSATTGTFRVKGGIATTSSIWATGNITGGNLNTAGNVVASGYLFGNGSQLTGIDATSIQSGTSSMSVISSGGNIRANIAGATVQVLSTGGANITGYVNATGNVTGSYFIGNGSQLTGIDATAIQNGSANVRTFLNGNVTTSAAGTANVLVVTSTGANIAGTLNATGNATFGNITATNSTATLTTAAQPNITSLGTLTSLSVTGNIAGGNLSGTSIVGTLTTASQTNITSVGTLGSLTVSGAITVNSTNGATAIVNGGTNGGGNIGASGATFNTIFAKATTAQYADLAEKYTADAEYAPGTVLHFGGSAEVTLCNTDMCSRIAGVVTTDPAYLMNSHLESAHTAAIALQGRVPTKVMGTTRKGDMMVSTGNGYARAEANPKIGTVIGKALEDFDGDIGTIEVAVGRI